MKIKFTLWLCIYVLVATLLLKVHMPQTQVITMPLPLVEGTVQPAIVELAVVSLQVVEIPKVHVPVVQGASVEQIRSVLISQGLAEWEADRMLLIAKYESGYNAGAYNSEYGASGVFQIIPGTWSGYNCQGNIYNAIDNTICAVRVLRGGGWNQWAVVSVYNL